MATAEPIIALRGVSKRFGGRNAVDDITVDVMPGRCFAWLGPNGCGKTTLIRMMLGLARPSAGEIVVRGHRIPGDARKALSRVGAIVEEPRFYPYLSGRDNLRIWAAHYDKAATARIDSELHRVGLGPASSAKVKTYSLGMRQRLGVARAMLNDPELLLLDEPTNGLDPAGLVEFRQMVRSFVEEGRTVFISSHILDEVERMADDVAIIQNGRMISVGSIAELTTGAGATIVVRVSDQQAALDAVGPLAFVERAEAVAEGRLALTVAAAGDAELQATARAIVDRGVGLMELGAASASLESRFLEITGGAAAGYAAPVPGWAPAPVQVGAGWPPAPGQMPQQQGGWAPAPGPGSYPPQQQGGWAPAPGQGGYPPQQQHGGWAPAPGQGGYPPQQQQGGWAPASGQGGYPPPQTQGGWAPDPGQGPPPQAAWGPAPGAAPAPIWASEDAATPPPPPGPPPTAPEPSAAEPTSGGAAAEPPPAAPGPPPAGPPAPGPPPAQAPPTFRKQGDA